mmetsp:Transcript_8039/g.19612  ORF Transcript_8039/g.19612 Transcript_8039/m.19612 type:complete len:221 (+) Transcript_8039:62-724(+)
MPLYIHTPVPSAAATNGTPGLRRRRHCLDRGGDGRGGCCNTLRLTLMLEGIFSVGHQRPCVVLAEHHGDLHHAAAGLLLLGERLRPRLLHLSRIERLLAEVLLHVCFQLRLVLLEALEFIELLVERIVRVERLLERRRDLRPQPAQRTRFRPPAFCRWFHGRLLPRRLRLARHNVQQVPPSRQHHRRRALPLGAARNPHRRRQKQPTRHHHGRPGHPPWW